MQVITHINSFGETLTRSISHLKFQSTSSSQGTFNFYHEGHMLPVCFTFFGNDYSLVNRSAFSEALAKASADDLKDAEYYLLRELNRCRNINFAFPSATESITDETLYIVRSILESRV